MSTRFTSKCGANRCTCIVRSSSGLANIAMRFFRRTLARPGRSERIVIDGSQTNHEAIISCDAIDRLQYRSRRALKPIRTQSQHLNNRIEQDHLRVRPMQGFKSFASATATLSGVEMLNMMRKQQARYSFNPRPLLAEQFAILAAAI